MRRIFLSLGLMLAGLLYPLASVAATFDLRIEDTIAGFGAEIEVEGPASTEVEVMVTPPRGRDFTLSGRTDSRGEAIIEVDPEDTEQAGMYEVRLEDAKTTFEVFPGAPSAFTLATVDDEELRAQTESILLAGVADEYGNPVSGRPLLLLADQGDVQKLDEETDEDGIARFAFTPSVSGKVIFTLVDVLSEGMEQFPMNVGGSSSGAASKLRASLLDEFGREDEGEEEADYGFVDHFAIESADRTLGINDPFDIAIVALDRQGKRVEDYIGRVTVETTDPDGQVPRTVVKFFASDRGRVELPLSVTFGTPGSHTLRVEDEEDSTIAGEEEFRVFGGDRPIEQGHIVITRPGAQATVGTGPVEISVHAPAYINLSLYDNGLLKTTGASNAEGVFTFSVTLDISIPTHTLYVMEGEGGLDRKSGSIVLTIDTTIPEIQSISLLPEKVAAGGTTMLTVTTSAQHTVRASLGGGEEVTLAESEESEEGVSVYQVTLTAPEAPGTYPVVITVSDAAGNDIQETKSLTVVAGGLPQVSGLTASALDRDVLLSWMAVPGASGYRVYFGVQPNDLAYHVDTGSAATSARLTGLQGGQTYYFAVTGLTADGRESEGRGQLTSATTRGSLFQLRLTPLVNSAGMEWVAPPGADVLAYRIQFGVQAGALTEQRLIGPGVSRFQIPDLINGVTYYVTIGALLRDGELLVDSAELSVTPGEGGRPGIRLSGADPLPRDVIIGSAPSPSHPSAPATPRSGLPLTLTALVSFFAVAGFFFLRRRKMFTSAPCPEVERIQW